MRTATKQLAVAVIVSLAAMTGIVWAQEQEQAKTPQQVVGEFWDAVTATAIHQWCHWEAVEQLLTKESREVLHVTDIDWLDSLAYWVAFPHLVAQRSAIDGETATVVALPQARSLEVKLVKEEGEWKVDLLGTLAALPEPFAVTAEELAAGAAAPQPQSGEQPPGADTGEAEQTSPVVKITLSNFKEEVLEAEIPVLLDFGDQRCDPCTKLKPVFQEIASEYIGVVKFASVNTDRNIPLAIAYEVNRIPCLVLLRGGEELARDIGYKNQQELRDWIEANLTEQD